MVKRKKLKKDLMDYIEDNKLSLRRSTDVKWLVDSLGWSEEDAIYLANNNNKHWFRYYFWMNFFRVIEYTILLIIFVYLYLMYF